MYAHNAQSNSTQYFSNVVLEWGNFLYVSILQ